MIFPATLGLLFPWLAAAGVLPSGSLVPRRVVSGDWQEAWTNKEVRWRKGGLKGFLKGKTMKQVHPFRMMYIGFYILF